MHVFLALLVCGTAVLCIALKVVFALWLCGMEWKQKQYLDQLGYESIVYLETALQVLAYIHAIAGCSLLSNLSPFPFFNSIVR